MAVAYVLFLLSSVGCLSKETRERTMIRFAGYWMGLRGNIYHIIHPDGPSIFMGYYIIIMNDSEIIMSDVHNIDYPLDGALPQLPFLGTKSKKIYP